MGVIFGVGMLLVLVALAAGSRREAAAAVSPAVKEEIKEAAKDAAQGTATPRQLESAAAKAEEAGMPKTAEALTAKADEFAEERKPLPKVLYSPWRDKISDEAWTAYVLAIGDARYGTISSGYNLGRWLMNPRALADLGIMENIRREKWQGREVWMGDFRAPMTLERWLASPRLQYDAILALTKRHRAAILSRYGKAAPPVIFGKPATQSGLMAVAKQAGMGGLDKFLQATDEERKKYPHTVAAFQRANGLF